jgi:hypothetical protein
MQSALFNRMRAGRRARFFLAGSLAVAALFSIATGDAQAQNRKAEPGKKAAGSQKPTATKPQPMPAPKPVQIAPSQQVTKPAAASQAKPASASVRSTAGNAPSSGQSSGWMSAAPSWTRNLRALDVKKGSPVGEVMALALKGDFVIVPLDFISDVWLANGQVRFFADRQEVTLVDLDLAANLALLSTKESLGPAMDISRIRAEVPSVNENLYALSIPDWVSPGAKFLRAKQDVSAIRYQLSLGGGERLSASYVFDSGGNLVAIASAERPGPSGKAETWAGSSRSLLDLITRQAGPKPASAVPGIEQRRMQLTTWQERWTQALSPSQKGYAMRFLECRPHHVSVSDPDLSDRIHRIHAKRCESRFSLPLGGGYLAGIELLQGETILKPATKPGSDADDQLAEAFSQELFSEFKRQTSMVNLLTTPECRESRLRNRQGQEVSVRFCTAALKNETFLNDTVIVVLGKESATRALMSAVRLKAFGQVQTKRILESLIENVRSQP